MLVGDMTFSLAQQWFGDCLIVGLLLGLIIVLFWLHHIHSLADVTMVTIA
jgi:hypothetical protein